MVRPESNPRPPTWQLDAQPRVSHRCAVPMRLSCVITCIIAVKFRSGVAIVLKNKVVPLRLDFHPTSLSPHWCCRKWISIMFLFLLPPIWHKWCNMVVVKWVPGHVIATRVERIWTNKAARKTRFLTNSLPPDLKTFKFMNLIAVLLLL